MQHAAREDDDREEPDYEGDDERKADAWDGWPHVELLGEDDDEHDRRDESGTRRSFSGRAG